MNHQFRQGDVLLSAVTAIPQTAKPDGSPARAVEATGVFWKPVGHVLSDGNFTQVLANAAYVKNVPGRKTDVNDATWLTGSAGAWPDPRQFRAGRANPGDAVVCCAPPSSWCASVAPADRRRNRPRSFGGLGPSAIKATPEELGSVAGPRHPASPLPVATTSPADRRHRRSDRTDR